jgi:hypothetical protein
MQCIICRAIKAEDEFNREHIFPEALGGTLVTRRVCVACNSRLGQRADGPLVNSYPMRLARMAYQLSGKSGVPNAFAGTARLADEPEQLVQLRTDDEGRGVEVRYLPRREKSVDEDGTTRIRLTVDAADRARLPEMVNKILQREGVAPLPPEDILARAKPVRHQPVVDQAVTYDVRSPRLGMLKIAYELAHRWLGDAYLLDSTALAITAALLSDEEDWATKFGIRGSVGMRDPASPLRMWAAEKTSHVALMTRSGSEIHVLVSLFQSLDARFIVSERADAHAPVEQQFIAMDAISGTLREGMLEDELARLVGEP